MLVRTLVLLLSLSSWCCAMQRSSEKAQEKVFKQRSDAFADSLGRHPEVNGRTYRHHPLIIPAKDPTKNAFALLESDDESTGASGPSSQFSSRPSSQFSDGSPRSEPGCESEEPKPTHVEIRERHDRLMEEADKQGFLTPAWNKEARQLEQHLQPEQGFTAAWLYELNAARIPQEQFVRWLDTKLGPGWREIKNMKPASRPARARAITYATRLKRELFVLFAGLAEVHRDTYRAFYNKLNKDWEQKINEMVQEQQCVLAACQ